jgi:hypothetical protein
MRDSCSGCKSTMSLSVAKDFTGISGPGVLTTSSEACAPGGVDYFRNGSRVLSRLVH